MASDLINKSKFTNALITKNFTITVKCFDSTRFWFSTKPLALFLRKQTRKGDKMVQKLIKKGSQQDDDLHLTRSKKT